MSGGDKKKADKKDKKPAQQKKETPKKKEEKKDDKPAEPAAEAPVRARSRLIHVACIEVAPSTVHNEGSSFNPSKMSMYVCLTMTPPLNMVYLIHCVF